MYLTYAYEWEIVSFRQDEGFNEIFQALRAEEAGQHRINYFLRRGRKKKILRTNKEVTGWLNNTDYHEGKTEKSAKQMQLLMYFSLFHCE